ncbi:MAG TPA: SDR family NAD(P)-dependent oxidoreductase [Chloroflexota bacterium]|nr:SDR family NAD(P)-dependent oxidoreductase [Chloroflexota bacterium]
MQVSHQPLAGKIAWVTGSSRGLGRVIATHLGTLGASLVVHGSSPTSTRAFGEGDSLASVTEAIAEESGAEVQAVHGDLTDPAAVERIVGEINARYGQIDILVNNAGGDIGIGGTMSPTGGKPEPNDAVFIPLEDVRAVIDRNLLSCILACKAVVPGMMERRRGWVVNFGSTGGLSGHVGGAIYATAKAAVHEYTRCLAAQLRPHNIPVNCIAPGGTVTPRFLATRQADPARLEATDTLERYADPIETSRAVAFLVADPGPFISGQIIRVDGGSQLWPA